MIRNNTLNMEDTNEKKGTPRKRSEDNANALSSDNGE